MPAFAQHHARVGCSWSLSSQRILSRSDHAQVREAHARAVAAKVVDHQRLGCRTHFHQPKPAVRSFCAGQRAAAQEKAVAFVVPGAAPHPAIVFIGPFANFRPESALDFLDVSAGSARHCHGKNLCPTFIRVERKNVNVDKSSEKRPQTPPTPKASTAKNVEQCVMTTDERYRAMVQLRGKGPAAAMILGEAIDRHVWQSRALDMFESHAFSGSPGRNRWCGRCMYQLDAHWKQPHLPLPPTCEEVAQLRDEEYKKRTEEAKLKLMAERATQRDLLHRQRGTRSANNSPLASPALDQLERQLGDLRLEREG